MAARLLVVCLPVLLAIGLTHTTDPINSTRRLNLFGWQLELENNEDMQSPECAECQFYTGRVLSEEVSMAMVTECDGRWYGLVQVGNEVFLLPKREEGHVLKKRDALLALVEENLSLFDLKDDTLPAPASTAAALEESVTKTRIHTRSSQTAHEDYFKYGQSDAPSNPDSKLWLELVIVADQTMLKFHGDARKVRHYILALMNIVSAIFNDRSLSASMTIVVSQIHVFDKYDPTHIRNGNMQEKLRRINQWNTKQLLKTYASSRWDALVWLTRIEAGVGSPAGIALPDGVCSLNHSATLQRDAGFTSAFVIAHELGHLLGMRHDDEVKFCGATAAARGRRVKTIMNSLVLASLDFSWSQCSRDTFHDKARKWKCLQERSGVEGVEVGGRKYHSEYSMDQQCRVAFGQGYSTCKLKMDSPPCSVLYCTHELDPGTCISKNNGEPPLEGTPCKKDHWCVGGECRLMPGLRQREEKPSEKLPTEKLPSEKLPSEKLPSEKLSHELQREPCAAACGYGLRKSSEHCTDEAGCDTRVESCWSGRRCARALDRRAELCRQLSHHYLPFVHQDKSKQCELWCEDRVGGEPYRVGDLPTGTPCSYGRPYDICFNGVCVPGNCDPSDLDCNACAGGRCRNHTSTMRPQLFDDDLHWTSLVIVPRGVHQFSIHITTPQLLDIAITIPIWNYTVKFKDHAKAQIQGNHLKYDISAPQSLRFVPLGDDAMDLGEEEHRMEGRLVVAGTVVEWTQGDKEVVIRSDSPAMSSLTFLGRHPKGYSFVMTDGDDIMTDTVNVSIYYTMVPRKVKRYRGPCSVSCGGGRRVVRTCGRHSCKAKYEPCNTQRCQFSWMTGDWEECSQTCGTAGLQERQLYCVPDQLRSYSLDVLKRHSVSPALCSVDLVPEKQRACNNFPCPVYWQELPWTECSTTCGPGQQHRPLQCLAEVDALCGPKPAVRRQICRRARCNTQAYHLSDSKTQAYRRSDSKDCGLYAARQLRTYCGLPYFRRRCNNTCQEMDT